ncbi:MAG: DinB family protein [Dehalococcoidia bacterium]|nr:DinB family protein [Dehalococcoidia bacterium]
MAEDDVRSYADERRRVLVELERERNQLLRNIETCRIRDIDRPFIGQWSLKDIVAHIASWEAEAVTGFRQLRDGQRAAILDFDPAHTDAWNEDHVQRMSEVNFFGVIERLNGNRHRLLDELANVDDEAIGDPTAPHHRVLQMVIDHDREHWHQIAAKLAGMAGVRKDPASRAPA